jgi:hypothetical protein
MGGAHAEQKQHRQQESVRNMFNRGRGRFHGMAIRSHE